MDWGFRSSELCLQRELEVTCISCWDPQAHIPLCQRSEVNGNISPFPGLKGHDFALLIKPSITHNQITASPTLPQSPHHSVPPSPFGKPWLNKAEECGGGGKELAGVSGSQWPRLKTKKSTCGSGAPWYVMLPLHGTHAMSTHACQHPGNSVYWCWRGQGSRWRWESSIPLSVFTVFKVGAQSTCLSGRWLNEWHNKKWNN